MIIRKVRRANQMISVLLTVAAVVLISALLPFFYEPSGIGGFTGKDAAEEDFREHDAVSVQEKISDGQELHAMLVQNNVNAAQEHCVSAGKNMQRRNIVLKFSVLAGLLQTALVLFLRMCLCFEDKHRVYTMQRRILGYIHSIDGKKELLPVF